jgi:acyl carrier protein
VIFERLKEILSEQFEVDEKTITPETDIMDDLGADSLDLVEFMMTLEEEYDVTVTEEVSYEYKTVGEIATYIESLI